MTIWDTGNNIVYNNVDYRLFNKQWKITCIQEDPSVSSKIISKKKLSLKFSKTNLI